MTRPANGSGKCCYYLKEIIYYMQQGLKWRYYNHAIIPTTAPHEVADESALKSAGVWKSAEGYPLLARWTTDFDCHMETDWWYVIKDTPFDFMEVKSNYRQKIRRGLKDFNIRIIKPMEYAEEIYQVEEEALSQYPIKYRPKLDHDQFITSIGERHKKYNCTTFAAFCKEDNCMAGYMCIIIHESYIELFSLKVRPSQERKQLNAALVYSILDHFSKELAEGVYIVDGERSILHETSFQDYLEKYFKFRKAYCRLHIMYRQGIKQIVACLYPLRGIISHLSNFKLFCHINSVLKMEKIVRKQKETCPT